MTLPLQITFHGMGPSDALRTHVEKRAEKLERYQPTLRTCHVTLEAPRRQHHGAHNCVTIDLMLAGRELAVSRDPPAAEDRDDMYAAINEAFDDAVRVIETHQRRKRARERAATTLRAR